MDKVGVRCSGVYARLRCYAHDFVWVCARMNWMSSPGVCKENGVLRWKSWVFINTKQVSGGTWRGPLGHNLTLLVF